MKSGRDIRLLAPQHPPLHSRQSGDREGLRRAALQRAAAKAVWGPSAKLAVVGVSARGDRVIRGDAIKEPPISSH